VSAGNPHWKIDGRNIAVRIKKSIKTSLTGVAVAALALTTLAACGGDDGTSSEDGGPESADIRVWLNGTDTPQGARDWLKKNFEDQNPGSTPRPRPSPRPAPSPT
jgi:N,N'-diacetylchitobiose transport system substrate-binding protein